MKVCFVLLLFVLLFVISPFYYQANLGGSGLELIFNVPVWIVASWIILFSLVLCVLIGQLNYPRLWIYIVIFPLLTLLSSFIGEVSHPIDWFFRQLYLAGGVLFLYGLFQFRLMQSSLDSVLLVLVVASGLQALLGTIQIIAPNSLLIYFPLNTDYVPRGIFQQINVQASFLATGVTTSLYLISRPNFRFSHFVIKVIVVFSFTLSMYVLFASGSRVGLLSLILSVPLVCISRYKQLIQHKKLLAIMVVLSTISFIPAESGLSKTIDKSIQLTEKSYSSARIAIYSIAFELVEKEPLSGYGIGNFLSVWNKQSSDFVKRHPETSIPETINHPHNEILLWMIEGGLLAVFGILAFAVGVLIGLYRCGFQRGGAYAAMLLPITLHTQVELPFYISSLHWFVWLFLIFLVLRHQTKTVNINLSRSMTRLIQALALLSAIFVTLFLINTAQAQKDIYNFVKGGKTDHPPLSIALNNLYTKNYAEQLAMRSMLYNAIQNNDREKVVLFESWAKDYVAKSPELKMYEDLISASIFLRPEENGCDAIKAGLAMYAHNKPLQHALEKCQ